MPCIGNDPSCPCQDGDMCHYRGPDAWPIPGAPEPPKAKRKQANREYFQPASLTDYVEGELARAHNERLVAENLFLDQRAQAAGRLLNQLLARIAPDVPFHQLEPIDRHGRVNNANGRLNHA